MADITQECVRGLLHYDPDTGIFTRKSSKYHPERIGREAGYLSNKGYRMIKIGTKGHSAHRLAFLYMTGSIPEQVDHINGIRSDNSWCNLRAANNSLNQRNTPKRRNNTSGVKGVTWSKRDKRWLAYLMVEGKLTVVGRFPDLISAELCIKRERARLHGEFANHG